MTMTRSETGLRVTEFSWLWGAIGVPLAVVFIWQSVLHVHKGDRPGETVVVILAAIFASAIATLLTQWSDFQFDAAARKLNWTRRSLFRSRRGVVAFDHIRFAVVQFSSGGSAQGPADSYRVSLSTEDGIIPLTISYSGGRVSDDRCRQIRSAINELLGVRFASEDDNDIIELHRTGNHAWAVLFAERRFALNSTEAHQYLRKACGEGVS